MPRFFSGRHVHAPEGAMATKEHPAVSSATRAIDPARLARDRSRISGKLPVEQMPRLADLLFSGEGVVSYAVQGDTSAKGQPLLHIRLTGDLAVCCQRCLGRLPLHLDVQRDLVVVTAEELGPLDDEDDDTDAITSTGSLDLHDLLEQEIVLSVPIAPRHAENVCGARSGAAKDEASPSPFSALEKLRRRPD